MENTIDISDKNLRTHDSVRQNNKRARKEGMRIVLPRGSDRINTDSGNAIC